MARYNNYNNRNYGGYGSYNNRNYGGYNANRNPKSKAKSGFKKTSNPDVFNGFRIVNGVLFSYMLTPPVTIKTNAKLSYSNKQGNERILYRVKVTNTQTGQVVWSIAYFFPEKQHFVSKPLGLVFKLNVNRKETTGKGGIFRLTNR